VRQIATAAPTSHLSAVQQQANRVGAALVDRCVVALHPRTRANAEAVIKAFAAATPGAIGTLNEGAAKPLA
jgi:precorrin-6B methylase 1